MALQAQQPAVKITLLGVQFHAERINGFLALLLLHFFKLLQALHHPDGKPHQGNNPPRRRCQPAVRQWFEPLFFIQRPRRPFHQIHTSRKIHASISSQKAETLNRGIAGRRADLSPLSSRGVGNLNTKTPVLFYCSAVNFCSSCSSRDGSQSATIICNPILNNIRYCCCASCTSPASSVNCAARYWR